MGKLMDLIEEYCNYLKKSVYLVDFKEEAGMCREISTRKESNRGELDCINCSLSIYKSDRFGY